MDATTFSMLVRERLTKSGKASVGLIRGDCMSPLLFGGGRVRLVRLEAEDPVPERIYAFEHEGGLFAHRFLGALDDGRLQFRGDSSPLVQVLDGRDALIGRVESLYLRGLRVPLEGAPWRVVSTCLGLALQGYRLALPLRVRNRLRRPLRGAASRCFLGRRDAPKVHTPDE